jgi:hypothetical protein
LLGLHIVSASRIAVLFGVPIKVARVVTMGIPSGARLLVPRNPGAIG